MTIRQPIQPAYGSGVSNTLGAAGTATVSLPATKQVVISNSGANVGYVRVGVAANGVATASAADFPILAGQQAVITKGNDDDQLKMFSTAGTTLHVIGAEGW
jgi:hypothetical protein